MKKLLLILSVVGLTSSIAWAQRPLQILAIGQSSFYCAGFAYPEAERMMQNNARVRCGTDDVEQLTTTHFETNATTGCWAMPLENVETRTVATAQFQCGEIETAEPFDALACFDQCMEKEVGDLDSFVTCHSQCGLW